MLYVEKGDLLDGSYDIICHQVNCKGVMGAGLAKQIADKWPQVYDSYKEYIKFKATCCDTLLGSIDIATIEKDQKWCINMFAQEKYGHGTVFTDYKAFQSCLNKIYDMIMIMDPNNRLGWTIAFPRGIGCGLAGGNWLMIYPMIEEFANKIQQDVIIVEKV